jgi:uncharacterized protein
VEINFPRTTASRHANPPDLSWWWSSNVDVRVHNDVPDFDHYLTSEARAKIFNSKQLYVVCVLSRSFQTSFPTFYTIYYFTMGSLGPETIDNSPIAVLNRFYDAERRYMKAGGKGKCAWSSGSLAFPDWYFNADIQSSQAGGASFDEFASTMSDKVVLHQTPDLPWGGDFIGIERYADWAAHMSSVFEVVDVQDAEFIQTAGKVIVLCTLVTKARLTGEIMKRPMAQVVTVSEGRIVDFRPFYWCVPDYRAAAEGRSVANW